MPVPHTVWQSRRAIFAGLATVLALASLLVLPPVRAAADALLSVFRVQRIVFVPVDPARIAQLQELQFNPGTLFVGKPSSTGGISRTVTSAAEAAAATGRAVGQPASLPAAPQLSEFRLDGGGQMQFQINTAGARQLLDALDIRDISIPDTLGAAPVMIDMPVYVSAHYRGAGYDLTLHQGPSPNVTLPDGVELAQLGKAALRVLGMTPEQAELASRQINWNTTLLFPFPADTTSVRQVTVGGEQALLVSGGPRRSLHGQLYWQHGDQLYMLQASGTGITAEADLVNMLLSTAESVR